MPWKTAGELLFWRVREYLRPCGGGAPWADFYSALEGVGGSPHFAEYIQGACAIHAMRRMLRYWTEEKEGVVNESQWQRRVLRFIQEEIFVGMDDASGVPIARMVIAAEAASNKPVKPGVEKEVKAAAKNPVCYLCGFALDYAAKRGEDAFVTLEHLWPTSLGGDSVARNLLPACDRCQDEKKDAPSWEWFNIHNRVLPPSPSPEALKAVPWRERIACHTLHVVRACEANGTTLKEEFLRAGPIVTPIANRWTKLPITFFDLVTCAGG